MAERLKCRVEWPYTKRCKGPAQLAGLRAQLKLGKGKRISRRALVFHRSKVGSGPKYCLHWGKGGLDKMEILSKKGLHILRLRSPPGVHNKYTRPLSGVRTVLQYWAKAQPVQSAGPFGRPQNGMSTHSSSVPGHNTLCSLGSSA